MMMKFILYVSFNPDRPKSYMVNIGMYMNKICLSVLKKVLSLSCRDFMRIFFLLPTVNATKCCTVTIMHCQLPQHNIHL